MLRHKKEIIIDLKNDFESEAKSILLKLEFYLRREGFHTSKDLEKIEFKRVYISLMYGNAGYIFKDGYIKLMNNDNKSIKLICSLSLDYLAFITLISSILISTSLRFFEGIGYTTAIITGAIIFLIILLIGLSIIIYRAKELIKICI